MDEMKETLRPATFSRAQKRSRATMEDAIFLLPSEQQLIFEQKARTKRQRLETNINPTSHITPPLHTTPDPFFETVSPDTQRALEWQNSAAGHVLASPASGIHTVGSLVGRVLDYRFACGPLGTFRAEYGRLPKAKYQLYLAKPVQTIFEDDFNKVVHTFETAQINQASTGECRHLIYPDGKKKKNIRFAENVFEKRPIKIEPPVVYMEDYEKRGPKEKEKKKETVDFKTEHWPVADEFKKYVDEIKYEYKANPLRVYGKNGFIEPAKVEEQLKGALIELRFQLHHYFIEKDHFHSFNAGIEQIIILQPGEASVPSDYKRKNVRDGPIPLDGCNMDDTHIDDTPVRKERRLSLTVDSVSGECIENMPRVGPISGGIDSTTTGKQKANDV
ncbi:hypothetical protein EDB85DRAFT_2274296 [Lactarius pseudohatsudake]|nr:hypothetical protein EDB85DRAFT_2274296 [Lactarius pseudohatsudake]